MASRPMHVPKFGNWDARENIPFTAVFDNARAGKGGGKMINPNDPSENPSGFGLRGNDPPGPRDNAEETVPPQPQHERRTSRDESDHNRPPREQNAGFPTRRLSGDAPGYRRTGGTQATAAGFRKGLSAGGPTEYNGTELGVMENQGVDQSPNHQAIYQGRLGNRPVSASPSPAWERKVSAEGGTTAPGTPGKSRLRPGPTRGDDTPDRSPALPKFGAWDEKDPTSGEGFTVIFNQARNEKKTGTPVRIPPLQGDPAARTEPHHSQAYNAPQKSSIWACFCPRSTVE